MASPLIAAGCPDLGVYVACLASYNAGRFYGAWLDLSDAPDADDIRDAIAEVLKASPEPGAEEYAIHDFCGLPQCLSRNEWPDVEQLAAYAAAVDELGPDDAEPYRLYCDDIGEVADVETFRAAFCGVWDSPEDFAADLVEQTGNLGSLPQWLQCHIDWAGVWRDLSCDGYSATYSQAADGYIIIRSV